MIQHLIAISKNFSKVVIDIFSVFLLIECLLDAVKIDV